MASWRQRAGTLVFPIHVPFLSSASAASPAGPPCAPLHRGPCHVAPVMQPEFRGAMLAYFTEMERCSFRLLEAFCAGLGMPTTTLHGLFEVRGGWVRQRSRVGAVHRQALPRQGGQQGSRRSRKGRGTRLLCWRGAADRSAPPLPAWAAGWSGAACGRRNHAHRHTGRVVEPGAPAVDARLAVWAQVCGAAFKPALHLAG